MKRNPTSAELPWTGERLVAGCGRQIIYEHLHRYAMALSLAKGKRVLDVACGEGYGSNLLASEAASVVGVDIDPPTIEHAQNKYARSNLRFLVGPCSALPIEDSSTDLVVSFETIEHVEEQEQFLSEIKRVLTPDGVLIISSPDKKEYSDINEAKNPFHKSELYHGEFVQLLKSRFEECLVGKQRLVAGSWVAPDLPSSHVSLGTFRGSLDSIDFAEGVFRGLYSIAVCSDVSLPAVPFGIFEDREESAGIWHLFEKYDRAEEIAHLILYLRDQIAQLRDEGERKSQHLAQLQQDLREAVEQLRATAINLAENEERVRELTERLRAQLSATRKLSRLFVNVEEASARLRSSRRWQIANPMAALRAKLSHDGGSVGYGHLDKIVSSYHRWHAAHPETDGIEDQIQALKQWPLSVPKQLLRWNHEVVDPAQLRFPIFEKVDVSIIIPVFNQFQFTKVCLASLQQNLDGQASEVIVVDDGSTDETAELVPRIEGLVYLRNPSNAGFVESCNAGAAKARGDYLVFLNNDTAVTERWLATLLETFQHEPRAGLVGSKLIFPDGRLQEAGGIIWNDASGWNYGKFDDAGKPEYNFLREVDYCSGACVMIPKVLFERVGGFDLRYAPGYYEDTDLAFKLRRCGYKALYQPLSEVFHFEGATGGTDLSTGAKRHQEVNRTTFATTWAAELAVRPAPGDLAGHFRTKSGEKRILIIDHHLPTPERDSGSLRMFQIVTILHELGHRVTFVPDNLAETSLYADQLRKRGIQVICHPYIRSVRDHLREHGSDYDVVVLSRRDFARKHIENVRQYAPGSRIIFDTVDLHFVRDSREAELTQDPEIRRNAEEKREHEYALIDAADETWVVSSLEQQLLQKERPNKRVEVVTNILDVPGSVTPFALRRDWLFIGSFQHTPNVDAVIYFVQEIYPLLRDRLSQAKFYVIGEKPPPALVRLANENVVIAGLQTDVRPYFDSVRLSIAPLRWGAGVKGKINQSMSFGVPVVATSIAVEGMELQDREDVLVADGSEAFADALVELYESEELWNRLSQNGIEKTKSLYSVEAARKKLRHLFGESETLSSLDPQSTQGQHAIAAGIC